MSAENVSQRTHRTHAFYVHTHNRRDWGNHVKAVAGSFDLQSALLPSFTSANEQVSGIADAELILF